jgi:hypothetical protein
MDKIPTLFRRQRNGSVAPLLSEHVFSPSLDWVATEKLNGANVRLTVRSGNLVRLEVRRNPSARQKENGIIHSWYRDASPQDSRDADYWLWRAAENTNLFGIPDGEWSGEAVGPNIQDNPLGFDKPTVYFFSLIPWRDSLASSVNIPPVIDRAPLDYDEIMEWLPTKRSALNSKVNIEGVVWWLHDEPVAKIKLKDF